MCASYHVYTHISIFTYVTNRKRMCCCVYVCIHVTLAGAWIQMAGLNRMWSHSCLSSKMPFCKLLRYLEKASTMSRTGRVTCTLEDWSTDRETESATIGGGGKKGEGEMSVKGLKDVESRKGWGGEKDTCRERWGGAPLLPNKHTSQLWPPNTAEGKQSLSHIKCWCVPVLVCLWC